MDYLMRDKDDEKIDEFINNIKIAFGKVQRDECNGYKNKIVREDFWADIIIERKNKSDRCPKCLSKDIIDGGGDGLLVLSDDKCRSCGYEF